MQSILPDPHCMTGVLINNCMFFSMIATLNMVVKQQIEKQIYGYVDTKFANEKYTFVR